MTRSRPSAGDRSMFSFSQVKGTKTTTLHSSPRAVGVSFVPHSLNFLPPHFTRCGEDCAEARLCGKRCEPSIRETALKLAAPYGSFDLVLLVSASLAIREPLISCLPRATGGQRRTVARKDKLKILNGLSSSRGLY